MQCYALTISNGLTDEKKKQRKKFHKDLCPHQKNIQTWRPRTFVLPEFSRQSSPKAPPASERVAGRPPAPSGCLSVLRQERPEEHHVFYLKGSCPISRTLHWSQNVHSKQSSEITPVQVLQMGKLRHHSTVTSLGPSLPGQSSESTWPFPPQGTGACLGHLSCGEICCFLYSVPFFTLPLPYSPPDILPLLHYFYLPVLGIGFQIVS